MAINATTHAYLFDPLTANRVLATAIAARPALDYVRENLKPSAFTQDRHKQVYSVLCSLADETEGQIDGVLLADNLAKTHKVSIGDARIAICDLVGPLGFSGMRPFLNGELLVRYVSKLNDLAVKRDRVQAVFRAAHLIEAGNGNGDVDSALDMLRDWLPTDTLPEAHLPWSMLAAIGESPEYLAGLQPITTGFANLDRPLGGFQPESVYVLGGRTGSAKSTLAANIARKVALLGHAVLLFKLEESRREATWRIHSAAAQVDLRSLMSGKVDDEERRRLDDAWAVIRDMPLRISDARNIGAIERISKSHVAAEGELIIIDQLSMIEVTDVDDAFQRVTRVSARLRLLARDLHVPILLVAQVNRPAAKNTKDRLSAHDLRDSGCLENDAAAVIMIDRARKPDGPIYGGQILRHLEIVIPKNRYGPTVFDEPLELLWWPVHCRIEDKADAGGQT